MRILMFAVGCLTVASSAFGQRGDFNGDGQYSCHDVDRLWQEFDSPNPDLGTFDLSGDGKLDMSDTDHLLGIASGALGRTVISGDFDFDGDVDRRDFLHIARGWWTPADGYCEGDIDNDGFAGILESNVLGVNWLFGADTRAPQADLTSAYERSGEGLIFARNDWFELIAYPEPIEHQFSRRLVATRVAARLRDPSHEFATVDQISIEGELLQVGYWWFGTALTPKVGAFGPSGWPEIRPSPIADWRPFDSHILVNENDVSDGAGGGSQLEEANDEADRYRIAEEFPPLGFPPVIGVGPIFSAAPTDLFVLRQNAILDEEQPPDWTELSIAQLVTVVGDDGLPGSVTLNIGLQAIDGNSDPLPELGIITDVAVPFLAERLCDRDFDGDCDFQDLPDDVFANFTDQGLEDWLADAGTVIGDTDLDGDVDVVDLNQIGINWLEPGEYGWRGGDLDGNGVADSDDLNQVGVNWQFGVEGQLTVVPEPKGVIALVVGLLVAILRRRNRQRLA